MAAGYALILAGFLLMSGPGSTDTAFCPDIFSVRRTGLAPVTVLSGFVLIAVGICLPPGKGEHYE